MSNIKFNKRFKDIFIMLTEFCPNRCEYCYIKNRDIRETISMETIDKIIKSFEYETPRIIFFGGEPLVEYDLMKQVIEKYKDKCTFQLVTSTSVNYDKFLEEIAGKNIINELQLSWDGMCKNRPDKNGEYHDEETFKKILETVKTGQQLDVKCVLSDGNIEYIVDTFIMFRSLRKVYNKKIHGDFCIAHQPSFKFGFSDKLEKGLRECLKIIKEDLSSSSDIYIPRDFLNKIIGCLTKDTKYSSCDAGNYIVARPNGDLYPCTIFSQIDLDNKTKNPFYIGNINDKTIKDDFIDEIKIPCDNNNCVECEQRYLCDGGCRYERYSKYEDLWKHNYCGYQCNNINTIAYEFNTWLLDLDRIQKKNLYELLDKYMRWTVEYRNPKKEK